MKAVIAALLAATLTAPAPIGAEDHMRTYLRETKAPGIAFAVIRGAEVVRQGAWGVDGNGRPMTAQTPFLLGSTSKSFTALATAQLAEAGRIDLDTAASTYLPWLPTARSATVRQLLTHTSGLPQVWSSPLTDRYDNRPDGLAASVRDLAGIDTHDTTYEYSDANYMILGALVEAVSGDTFGAYLRRHVLDPLGMTHSAATAEQARAIGGVPPGHRYHLGRPQRLEERFDTAGVPYGFLAASLDDLTRYTVAQLNGDPRLLGAEAWRQLHTGTADTGHGTYAFGWQNSTLDGIDRPIVWHAGATPDYFSHIVLVPGEDLAVVVMANVYGLPMDPLLAAGAFDLARVELGGTPATAAADPMHVWVLVALGGIALALLAGLVRALLRPGRSLVVTAGCAVLAACAAWAVPSLWKGAGLAKLQLWAPDVGHAIWLVIILAAVLGLLRAVQPGRRRSPAKTGGRNGRQAPARVEHSDAPA